MAAYAVAGVAAFAIAFIALCSALGAFADSQQHSDSLQLSVVEHKDPFYVLLIGSDSRKGTALYTGQGFRPCSAGSACRCHHVGAR